MLELIIKLSEILFLFLFVCFLFHYLFYVYYIIYSISDFSSVKACSSAKFPLTNRGVRSDSTLFCVKAVSISPELDLVWHAGAYAQHSEVMNAVSLKILLAV